MTLTDFDEPDPYWDGRIWVCTDCYFTHHYGAKVVAVDPMADDGPLTGPIGHDEVAAYLRDGWTLRWYVGDADEPCDREPLSFYDDAWLADDTDSNTGDGIHDFSWQACDGCGSSLGGSRYRLAWKQRTIP